MGSTTGFILLAVKVPVDRKKIVEKWPAWLL